ncbi:hypothetical protein RYX36_034401, partial [Vicia faba]
MRLRTAGASYSLKWIFHNDLGFKREYSQVCDPTRTVYRDFDEVFFKQLEIEAKARAEELKESNSNLVVMKGNRKNQVTWKGDGFEGKRNGTTNGGDGKDIDNWNNGAVDVYKLQKKVRNKGGNGKEIDTDITKTSSFKGSRFPFSRSLNKGSLFDTLNRSCLLEERSDAASYSYDAPGASYSLKWIFHNDLGFKREYSRVCDPTRTVYRDFDEVFFKQLETEAKARAEELKESNSNLVVMKGNRKNQVTWRGDGFEGKRNGTGNGGDGKDIDNWNNGAFDVYKLQKKVRNKGGNGKEIDTDITK